MADQDEISVEEKVRIASDFIKCAPPGEFNEVFNDVRLLLNNDQLLKENCASAYEQYSKEQSTPVRIEGIKMQALVTEFNDLGSSRFFDPRSKKSFFYDHLRKEASEFNPWDPDSKAEPLRSGLQTSIDAYVANQYSQGASSTFGKSDSDGNVQLSICIEAHTFKPKNYLNGRWRSQWTTTVGADKQMDLKGIIKVQVHYYEDGNVQLVSTKEIARKINKGTDQATINDIVKAIEDEETTYQKAVCENYQTMSETTFKALRRQLPVTRSKLDWNKILSYKIGSELKAAP